MALEPKLSDSPRIRKALGFYKVTSVITGVMLLLLCVEMILKYAFKIEVYAFGEQGLFSLAPVELMFDDVTQTEKLMSKGDGFNLSTGFLIAHGWFYVVYLFSIFLLWSPMRWPFLRFLLLALGGVIPFLSFFLEARTAREVESFLATRETTPPTNTEAAH